MVSTTSERIWFKQLLKELKLGEINQMKLICANQVVVEIFFFS